MREVSAWQMVNVSKNGDKNNATKPLTELLFFFPFLGHLIPWQSPSGDQGSIHHHKSGLPWCLPRGSLLRREPDTRDLNLPRLPHSINLAVKQRVLLMPTDAKLCCANGKEH